MDSSPRISVPLPRYLKSEFLDNLIQEKCNLHSFGSKVPFNSSTEQVKRFAILVLIENLEIDPQAPKKKSFEINNIPTPTDEIVQKFIQSTLRDFWETHLLSLDRARNEEFTNLMSSDRAPTQVAIFAHFAIASKEKAITLLPVEEVEGSGIEISNLDGQQSEDSFSSSDIPPVLRESSSCKIHNEVVYYTWSHMFSLNVQTSEPLIFDSTTSPAIVNNESCCSAM
jgi:hypothetical protein